METLSPTKVHCAHKVNNDHRILRQLTNVNGMDLMKKLTVLLTIFVINFINLWKILKRNHLQMHLVNCSNGNVKCETCKQRQWLLIDLEF